jgi:hypothetical protein
MCAHQVGSYVPRVNADGTTESSSGARTADHCQYEIRVKGHLEARWKAWFDGLSITNEDDGTTVIHGPVVDQAALHGVLQKLRDVGVHLISVTEAPAGAPATARHAPRHDERN